jgi:hypothetical protein
MHTKLFKLMKLFLLTPLLFACSTSDPVPDFDPKPYLTEAYQSLTAYESKPITPFASKWIYTYEENESLSVFHLFVEFTIPADQRNKYAILTIYIDRDSKTLVNSFIDRMYNDELEATVSSLSSYNTFYQTVLNDMRSVEAHIVLTGVITLEDIQSAMANVQAPTLAVYNQLTIRLN